VTETTVDQTPATINLVFTRGDNWAQTFRFLTGTTPFDLTGYTITAAARSTLGELVDLVVTVTDPADGEMQLAPPAAGLEPDLYRYDVQADFSGSVQTWITGYLRVEEDVTP